ncbi:mechanosensitive ion channel protein MscS [Odoribacter splanchnicus]|nr:mechanosensitive ion channel [Odoribacter sp.]NUN81509.1 mechanosensitive ion channel [Odoribacter splanchnicus]MBP8905652.1 mechanosensitive ion channel [Odoribacter sp.]RGU54988.1 mechanosensitive ion channel protein MscS [Odoribacter splanchnicus]RGU78657.1 mechanosensitive ion channel protein MscS [Odoribacter splanchnicus]
MTDDESTLIKMAITITVAILIYIISRKWLSKLLKKVVGKTKSTWDDILYDQGFFRKLASLIPPFTAYIVLTFITWEYKYVLRRLVDIWLIIVTLFIITSLLNAINKIYESYPVSKNRPITFFIQLIKVFLYTVVVITVVSVLVNKSPEHLIVGLSAFAAVLLLIFKDSILGFVAGIQLTSNNMIRIGDWIQMDKNNANGVVLEVNLYTVKVQNWDMTISMVPTYQLVSESFTNWRGMQESPGRRIMRSINIDIDSVHFLSHDEVVKFASSAFLKDYIDQMVAKLGDINKDKITILDERKLTNIGIFRYYMDAWIEANPDINTNMTHMVRQLQPGPTGMPIQIYCFSAIQEWVTYEKVQADIFDHIMAVLPEFGLKVFEYKSMYVGGENQS